jgi:hypothetical protein
MGEMRPFTIRFSPSTWEALTEEARRDRVSRAQFVREATVGRIAYERGRRYEDGLEQRISDAIELLRDQADYTSRRVEQAISSIVEHAADRLNDLIAQLDDRDPDGAAAVRELYSIPPTEFLK